MHLCRDQLYEILFYHLLVFLLTVVAEVNYLMQGRQIVLIRQDGLDQSEQFCKYQSTCPDIQLLIVLWHAEHNFWRVVAFCAKSVCFQLVNADLFAEPKIEEFSAVCGD